jgi:hypothetical protein
MLLLEHTGIFRQSTIFYVFSENNITVTRNVLLSEHSGTVRQSNFFFVLQ